MADATDPTRGSAEQAYAEAASEAKPVDKAAPPVSEPAQPFVAGTVAAPKKPAVTRREMKKPATLKPAAKTAFAKAAGRVARVARAAAAPAVVKTTELRLSVSELKENIMATAKTTDFAKPIADAFGDYQARAKVAYDKSAEAVSEATDFTKGNVEALVESSKIFAAGAQDLGKGYAEEAKSAYETLTADFKEMAAIKSPTELFQLQAQIVRRNFDSLVAASTKNTEALVKLANDSFAPISGRVDLAAKKLSKAA